MEQLMQLFDSRSPAECRYSIVSHATGKSATARAPRDVRRDIEALAKAVRERLHRYDRAVRADLKITESGHSGSSAEAVTLSVVTKVSSSVVDSKVRACAEALGLTATVCNG